MEYVAGVLDHFRSSVLRATLALDPLRLAFLHRAARLAGFFLLSCALSLALALKFPLWVLALGPALYGVPHLFATIRYFEYACGDATGTHEHARSRSAARSRGALWLASVPMVLVPVYRLIVDLRVFSLPTTRLSEWSGSIYLELLACMAVFLAGLWIYRVRVRRGLVGAAFLSPLVVAFWVDPLVTVGALVLIHNFVAFAYWYLACRTRTEKGVAIAAGLAVLGITALIFSGAFDAATGFPGSSSTGAVGSLAFARLSFADIGALIAPGSEAQRIGLHAAVAYAFGQSMHYFVWLKAIPDQYNATEAPTSFRQSLRLFEKDFGFRGTRWMLALIVASFAIWAFVAFPKARLIYFALAGFHGYLEIAGLALVAAARFGSKRSLATG